MKQRTVYQIPQDIVLLYNTAVVLLESDDITQHYILTIFDADLFMSIIVQIVLPVGYVCILTYLM